MAETVFRGPEVSLGSLMDGRVEPFDGPVVQYQGAMVNNPIFSPQPKDGLSPGRMHGWYQSFDVVSVDAIPEATASNVLAATQTPSVTVGTALNLVTATVGTAASVAVFAPGIPFQPLGTNQIVTVGVIDFGFTTVGMTAASTTLNAVDNRLFQLGQWICIPGAGGATNTPLFTQVTAISSTSVTAISVSPAPQTTATNVPVGQANLYSQNVPYGTQFGPPTATPTAVEPYRLAGLAAGLDPAQCVTRNITVTGGSTTGGTTAVLVTGYDIYGQLMAEKITQNGVTLAAGKKAFKYIQSIATLVAGSTANLPTLTVGLGDEIGLNVRMDNPAYTQVFYGFGWTVGTTGFTTAVTTPANNTSGDVRGTVNASTIVMGLAAGTAAGGTLNGVNRMTIFQSVSLVNSVSATPLNYTSLIGVAQATA